MRAAVLTGLSTAVNAAIAATDTILVALGKLQRQITDNVAAAANASNRTSGTVNKERLPAQVNATQVASLAEGTTGPNIAAGTLTIDCSQCNGATITLNANITTLNLPNVPADAYALYLRFIGDGTVRTVAFGASVKWGAAGAPTMTGTLNKEDWISLITVNQGASSVGNAKLNL